MESRVLYDSGIVDDRTAIARDFEGSAIPSPPHSPDVDVSPVLRHLLDETADLVDSPLFNRTLTALLDTCFSHLTDQKLRFEAFKIVAPTEQETFRAQAPSTIEIERPSAKLATILAVMTKEAHKIGHGLPNDYVQVIENVTDLEAFAAVIYSSNLELPPTFEPSDSRTSYPATHRASDESLQDESESKTYIEKAAALADSAWCGLETMWAKVAG